MSLSRRIGRAAAFAFRAMAHLILVMAAASGQARTQAQIQVVRPVYQPAPTSPAANQGQVMTTTPPAATGDRDQPATAVVPDRPAAARPKGELPADVFASLTPEERKKTQARLQKVRQLTFDRRPSTILRAWATPREEALKQAGNPSTAGGPMGAVLSSSSSALIGAGAGMEAAMANAGAGAGGEPNPADEDFDRDLKAVQLDVTLGAWEAVRAAIGRMEPDVADALYAKVLQGLATAPAPGGMNQAAMIEAMNGGMMTASGSMAMAQMQVQGQPQSALTMERNQLSNRDVIDLARIAPGGPFKKEWVASLGRLAALAIGQGHAVEDLATQLRALVAEGQGAPLDERRAALLLFAANQPIEAGLFLPDFDWAVAANDREALNLLARHELAVYQRDQKAGRLERAWAATQAALAAGEIDREQKEEAIRRAVEMAPKISAALGREWLETSFTDRPERGMEIIAAIGAEAAQGPMKRPQDIDFRLKSLELQKLAVDTLLGTSPERAGAWRDSLALLAEAWMKEAELSRRLDNSTSMGPRMQYDPFGNVYYMNPADPMSPEMMMQRQNNMPRPILSGDVLKNRPGDAWLGQLDEGDRPRLATLIAQLLLKVNEEDEAFPFIEALAATHPRQARALAEEFVRTWTKNHDPNSQQLQRSRFFYVYGFESRAEGIPLTRSKQERNLVELAGWVEKIRKLPIDAIDEALLTRAFTTCHSTAEVYRLEAIRKVFGSFDSIKPTTLAGLIQQMRGNLVTVWRQPDQQQQQKTRRKEQDIRAEVLRGYEVARSVVDQGLARHPDHWALVLARAAVLHDENNYLQELERSPEFVPRRREAMAEFRRAAELYVAAEPALTAEEQSTEPFDMWFLAALGACDVGAITDASVADPRQPPLIKQALDSLAGEAGQRHRDRFANALFTRLNAVKPSVKVRYLKHGLEIAGENPQTQDARKVFEYYRDLITEVRLEAAIDGPDVIGVNSPFGVFVNLVHTREIERESGGFGRYLQNQNNGGMMFYNFGRPLVNYRDKFQEVVQQALGERFEVVSVTFQDEKVNSRATSDYGWRVTPYAYLLLKARGPMVDRIAPLRLDLDFMDTSGYVVLPVESAPVPLEVAETSPPARPFGHIEITQVLDERQADGGKLIVEAKATGQGLIPEIGDLLDLDAAPEGFRLAGVEDQGLAVSRFNPDSAAIVVDSERSWLISYAGAIDREGRATTFRFPAVKIDGATVLHRRYVDADLATVGPEVALESRYGRANRAWLWGLAIGLPAALLALAAIAARLRRRPRRTRPDARELPDPLTPFTVLGLLREIERGHPLPPHHLDELGRSITRLEQHYFSGEDGDPDPDLRHLASTWIARSS